MKGIPALTFARIEDAGILRGVDILVCYRHNLDFNPLNSKTMFVVELKASSVRLGQPQCMLPQQ